GDALDRLALQSDTRGGDLQTHPRAGRGDVAGAEAAGGAELAFADAVGAPEGAGLPAVAVVPLQHERPGLLAGGGVQVGEEDVALAGGLADRVAVEPVADGADAGRLGVGHPAGDALPVPRAARGGARRRLVLEPAALLLALQRDAGGARLQQLDVASGHVV